MSKDDVMVGELEDIIGELEDIIGDDVALFGIGALSETMQRLAAVRQADPKAVATARRRMRARRRQPIGFTSIALEAGTQGTITAEPQQLFKPKRLIISSALKTSVEVDDVLIGNRSQFVDTRNTVIAAVFSELAVGTGVDFLTANVGNKIDVKLTNITAGTVTGITASVIGVVAEA